MTLSKSTLVIILVSALIGGFIGFASARLFTETTGVVKCQDLPPVLQ